MLGRKDYTQDELDNGRALVQQQLSSYAKLAQAADAGDEATYFTSALLALDRLFVHRVRLVTGKDTNPLNEVELMVASILDDGAVFSPGTVVRYQPEKAVVGLRAGDPVALTQEQYARLASAFLDEIEAKFR